MKRETLIRRMIFLYNSVYTKFLGHFDWYLDFACTLFTYSRNLCILCKDWGWCLLERHRAFFISSKISFNSGKLSTKVILCLHMTKRALSQWPPGLVKKYNSLCKVVVSCTAFNCRNKRNIPPPILTKKKSVVL